MNTARLARSRMHPDFKTTLSAIPADCLCPIALTCALLTLCLALAGRRFRAMVEKSAEGIVLGTPERGVTYASPSVEQVLGYRPDEFAGRSLYGAVHPDHCQHVADAVAELLVEPNKVSSMR
jgi:PAS domain-containing protein